MTELKLPIAKEISCDVLVLGGGAAGIASAIAAARHGADTILADQNGHLGGTATAGLVAPFMTSYNVEGTIQLIRGFYDELITRMEKEGGAVHPSKGTINSAYTAYRTAGHQNLAAFEYETLKRVSEEICEESGVHLMYHMTFLTCDTENGKITAAYFATKAGIYKINAKMFIDCSGDADLADKAGAPTVYGNGEGDVQAVSLFFTVRGVDKEKMDAHMHSAPDVETKFYMKEIVEEREKGNYPLYRNKIMLFEGFGGEWVVNMAQVDGVNGLVPEEVTSAEITSRQQIGYILRFLRKYVAGCENVELAKSAASLGVRETRRIIGVYNTKKEDAQNSVRFDDAIFCCANSMDIHTKGYVNYVARKSTDPYYIPYRSLLPLKVDNLLVAGRCAAGDREVLAAIRVMPPCFAMGQAAGTAAALSLRDGVMPKELCVKTLVDTLLRDGVYIHGVSN